ncbi:MAG: hypothetical protein QM773_13745 [Hyphomonadaceae bacterium]
MLSAREAAEYVGLPAKRFQQGCPVRPIELPGGGVAYDMHDLDKWIDALKAGTGDDDDSILDKLG